MTIEFVNPGSNLNEYLPRMRRVIQRIAKDEYLVDDIMQECCIRIIQKENLCRNEGKVNAWINTAVRNLTLDHMSRKRWERSRSERLPEDPPPLKKNFLNKALAGCCGSSNPLPRCKNRSCSFIILKT